MPQREADKGMPRETGTFFVTADGIFFPLFRRFATAIYSFVSAVKNRKIACHLQLSDRDRWDRFCPGTVVGLDLWEKRGIPGKWLGCGGQYALGRICRQVNLSLCPGNYLPILTLFLYRVAFLRLVCRVASFQCRKGRSGRLTTAH